MTEKAKPNKPAYYTIDFTTALPVPDCRRRLEQADSRLTFGVGGSLAPVTQQVVILKNDQFIIERSFPGAIHPIRLIASLDADDAGGGTWVHGAITHDTENQVLIEGLVVFVAFFVLSALFFLRLRAESFLFTVPLLLIMLFVMSLRWRALRSATRDLALFLRRRLYLTEEQVRKRGTRENGENDAEPISDEQLHRSQHRTGGL